MSRLLRSVVPALFLACSSLSQAQQLEIPRRHDRPPGPPISAEEAVKKMTVPEGFSVEIVAAEPDVVNPVGMFIDEKGHFWITESFEYPRREAGPGKDRIKVLEDTDGDGKVDKVTVFAEGLNIPSGIAVGHGGVWVANSPDILFLQDTDGDLKADKSEVVVTGFGRDDTHELPNSFTWGPDGWLYGLNGVFNYCHVKYGEKNPNYKADHPGWQFTCAMFRIHPRTREFQIFAQGTSNPWGIAINDEGDFFISACVIDHLWHIVETGYYIRQGGPYPPHTWPMRSIVDHKHQLAAYCGITWFDSDAYPEEYRRVLYMGNIHGGCINADIVERAGSTYKGKPHPGFPAKKGAWDNDEFDKIAKTGDPANPMLADFLTANDPWFMPVVQKTGPDGCLYILDWYDRYHCYQDANADPAGIERARGRLYRVVYKGHQNRRAEDLGAKSDDELITLLGDANVYKRETAQRLLQERGTDSTFELLHSMTSKSNDLKQHRHAMFAAIGMDIFRELAGTMEQAGKVGQLLNGFPSDSVLKRWHFRYAFELAEPRQMLSPASTVADIADGISTAQNDDDRLQFLLQRVISTSKVEYSPGVYITYLIALKNAQDDALIPHVVWQNLYPNLLEHGADLLEVITAGDFLQADGVADLMPRVAEVFLSSKPENVSLVPKLLELCRNAGTPRSHEAAIRIMNAIQMSVQSGSSSSEAQEQLKKALLPFLHETIAGKEYQGPYLAACWLAASFGDPTGTKASKEIFAARKQDGHKLYSVQALLAGRDPETLALAMNILDTESLSLQREVMQSIGRLDRPEVATEVLQRYGKLEAEIKPRAIELLTQRPNWSKVLLTAIGAKQIDKDTLNMNQLRRVASFKDEELQKQFVAVYGTIREGRNPNREQMVNKMRDFLHGTPGDPHAGVPVFKKVCAQCHKMYGEGAEVGPEITRNGRNNWDQLLQNVFDPSAVIGPGYQARVVATTDGRILTGLPVEESEQRIVLKIQGGKLETIPRDQIDEYKVSELSMMPEELEKLVTPQELADLMAYLALDKPPTDPEAKILSGAPMQKRR